MEVLVAPRYAGFCGGVKRAWRLAHEEAERASGPVYLSGKLIHNDPAMRELAEMGVGVAESPESAPAESTIIVRAHGEGPGFYERAEQARLRVVDATCSIVKAVQRRARALEERGYQVVLFGHARHPEALATIAHTQRGVIVESAEQARLLPRSERIAVIAQTTAPQWEYERVCDALRERCDVLEDQGRICGWTLSAQEEAAQMARQVQAMVVIGGRDSSNSRRLVEVCSRHSPTHHVETAAELDPAWFAGVEKVGVTAGASTRDGDVEAVVAWLRTLAG